MRSKRNQGSISRLRMQRHILWWNHQGGTIFWKLCSLSVLRGKQHVNFESLLMPDFIIVMQLWGDDTVVVALRVPFICLRVRFNWEAMVHTWRVPMTLIYNLGAKGERKISMSWRVFKLGCAAVILACCYSVWDSKVTCI